MRRASPSPLEQTLDSENCELVRQTLARMKPAAAQILLLRADDRSYREIAQALGISVGSVGTLLARAEADFKRRYWATLQPPNPRTTSEAL